MSSLICERLAVACSWQRVVQRPQPQPPQPPQKQPPPPPQMQPPQPPQKQPPPPQKLPPQKKIHLLTLLLKQQSCYQPKNLEILH